VIDPQRDIIDHRQRSKSLGQATQINGRQSNSSPCYFTRIPIAKPVSTFAECALAPLSASYLSLDQYKHE
jgi:hypothetical protein